MKKLITALAFTLVTGFAVAQTAGTSPSTSGPAAGGKHPNMEQMKDSLGLTDEQVQKMREIRDNGGTREEMNAVLTPEQRVKAETERERDAGKVLHDGEARREQEEAQHLGTADLEQRQARAEADRREERDHERALQRRVELEERHALSARGEDRERDGEAA